MALWRLYYHLVWATKDRRDLITLAMEDNLFGYIIGKSVALGGIVHAINGTENHVHLVASIPPKISISAFVKGIKGASSHNINKGPIPYEHTFRWQGGYGIFSLGQKQLPYTIAYVQNQKEHHRNDSTIPVLERIDQEDDGPTPWQPNRSNRE